MSPTEVIRPTDPSYPDSLRSLGPSQSELRVRGQLPNLDRTVSIVGTRVADDEALDFTHRLAAECAAAGFVVVSGGALGVDGAAHEGALDAGGQTVVVLPVGFDNLYPREHIALFGRVEGSGCLLTEVADGTPMQRGRFLARNRIIAALGQQTVVVQAPARSGALSTARQAERLGRQVWVVPAAPWDARSAGNLGLLRSGARICMRPSDVLSAALVPVTHSIPPRADARQEAMDFTGLGPLERQLLESLGGRPRHPDDLCQRTGIPAVQVQRGLMNLLVAGLVEERPGGRFKSCRAGDKSY